MTYCDSKLCSTEELTINIDESNKVVQAFSDTLKYYFSSVLCFHIFISYNPDLAEDFKEMCQNIIRQAIWVSKWK